MYSETLQGSNVCFLLFVTILIYGLRVLGSLSWQTNTHCTERLGIKWPGCVGSIKVGTQWGPMTDEQWAPVRNLRTSPYARYSRLSVGYPGSLLELCLSGDSLCMGFVKHMRNAVNSSKRGKQSALRARQTQPTVFTSGFFFFFTPWKILAENKAWSRLRYGKKKKDYKIKKFNRPYKTMMDLLIVVIRLSGGGHAHIQLCRAVCVITGNRSHGSWQTTLVYSNVAWAWLGFSTQSFSAPLAVTGKQHNIFPDLYPCNRKNKSAPTRLRGHTRRKRFSSVQFYREIATFA